MDRLPEHEAKAIRSYVDLQTRDDDDLATTVQKIGARRLAGRDYEFYDVRTAGGSRWWVITNATNLYDQEAFPTVDQAFSLHLGLMQQLIDRGRREGPDEPGSISPAWRRFQQAAEAMNGAGEAEDYQAVGLKCREALIALTKQYRDADWLIEPAEPPKAGDVKGWLTVFAETLIPSRRPRAYVCDLAETTWDLAVWLQHYTDARDWDAEMVLDATAHLINAVSLAIIRHEEEAPERCPNCDSYRLTADGDLMEQNGKLGWWHQPICSACGWRGADEFSEVDEATLERLAARLSDERKSLTAQQVALPPGQAIDSQDSLPISEN